MGSRRPSQTGTGAWLAVVLVAGLTAVPVLVVLASLWQPQPDIWEHLRRHLLPELLVNSVWLLAGVGAGVTLVGVSLAWLTARCEFPGRGFFFWALLLPLAVPAYVTAFVWLGLVDISSPLAGWLRGLGLHPPPIRSRGGVILVMTLALYPYVYLTAHAAFRSQGPRLLEAARSLGLSRWQAFWRVSLPMARPGILAGLGLALMETLADFGTVAVFNYDVFTTAIYKAWFALYSLTAASQLASLLILAAFAALLLERMTRGNWTPADEGAGSGTRLRLSGASAWLALTACGSVWLLAFLVPVVQILAWALASAGRDLDARYLGFAWHSLLLSGLGALLVTLLALVLAYAQRWHPRPGLRVLARFAAMGYAVPGAVLAVGIVVALSWLDARIKALAGLDGSLLTGTLTVVLAAYVARFLAVGLGPVEAGLGRVTPGMDEAAQSLGVLGWERLRRVHLPILRPSLLAALALTFVDLMKELPITLMTRPFGWDTLAVRVFEMTSEGEWERAALPAILITLAGLLPVAYLIRRMDHAGT